MKKYVFLLNTLLLFFFAQECYSQEDKVIEELTFTQAEVNSVLKVIAEAFQVTIVPEKDVQGSVTRYFRKTTLKETLELLLTPLGFSYREAQGIYYIEKRPAFSVTSDKISGMFSIEAENASLQEIVSELSGRSQKTIIFKGNSADKISLKIYGKSLTEVLKLLAKTTEYEVIQFEGSFIFQKKEELSFAGVADGKSSRILLEGNEDSIRIKFANQASKDVILLLFTKYNKELILLSSATAMIPYLEIKTIDFDSLLTILCEYAGMSFTKESGKYTIYDSISPKMINRQRQSLTYKFQRLNPKLFQSLLPNSIIPPSSYKIEEQLNCITLYGSDMEIQYFLDIIKKTEEKLDSYTYAVFSMKYRNVKDIKNILPEYYKNLQIQIIEDNNMFYAYMTREDEKKLREFLDNIDILQEEYSYKCKYLKPDDVVKNLLPEYVDKKNVFVNANDSSIIYKGGKVMKDRLWAYLSTIDIAPPVIRYQLLIVEYMKKDTFKWDWSLELKPMTSKIGEVFRLNSASAFRGDPGDLLKVNFDIPTVFGHYFNAELSQLLSATKAKIQMSTEVYGLSGESVSLANTKTVQVSNTKKDENGNDVPYYSSTTFGLNMEIKGRATSSNEIFIEITTKISDEFEQRLTNQPPNTSEKSVKNTIRSQSGKPIILGGLNSRKESVNNKILPGLGHIPFLGEAFKTHNNSYDDSEFVIYIIPFIHKTQDDIEREQDEFMGRLYKRFVRGE